MQPEIAKRTIYSLLPPTPTPRNPDDREPTDAHAPSEPRRSPTLQETLATIRGETRAMLGDILGENQEMLADIGQGIGKSMNEIVRSNDQIFRDMFGEGMDTMFRRPEAHRGRVGAQPVHRKLPTTPTRLIEEGAIEAELIEYEPREHSRVESTPDILEAEIVTKNVDRGTQIIQQTSSAVRAAARLRQPRAASELAAQAISDMRARRSAITAYRSAKIEQTRAFIRRRRR